MSNSNSCDVCGHVNAESPSRCYHCEKPLRPGAASNSTTSNAHKGRFLIGILATLIITGVVLVVIAFPIISSRNRFSGNKKIYFVPIGDFPSASLKGLVADYKQKLNLSVEILPRIELDRTTMDLSRKQFVAEDLITLMKNGNPALASDPQAIFVGYIRDDIYIRSKSWQFAFSLREDNRFAVISTARLDPANYGLAANSNLLQQRTRKMTTKNIGLMYYQLPVSHNPNSVLYGSIMGLEELDRVTENF